MRPLRRHGRPVDFTDRIVLGRSAPRRDLPAAARRVDVPHPVAGRTRDQALAARARAPRHRGTVIHTDQETFFAEQLARAAALLNRRVRWAGHAPSEVVTVEAITATGMVFISGYPGEFAPHLFTVVES